MTQALKFTPLFKENDSQQFYFENGEWVSCGESKIHKLWSDWVCSLSAERYYDEQGFLIFGYKNK
jgi:hypothetical protein